jgi:polyhydroxyalkanoate synthase
MEDPKERSQEESLDWTKRFSQLTEKSQLFFSQLFEKRIPPSSLFQMIHFNQIYQKFLQHLLVKPEKLLELELLYWQELFFIWQGFMWAKDPAEKSGADKRFKNEVWQEHPFFKWVKDFYLLHVRHFQSLLTLTEGLDSKTVQQIQFYLKQITEAFAPANFAATNPEVWRATLESRGENLLKGLDNAIQDLQEDKDYFQIKMTDAAAFEVGKNVAITPGKVIYQNAVMQLIQYEPQTKTVFKQPFLMIPPWINKYYILDLNPSFSLVNWLVQQGYTVFMISWINPTKKLADKDFAAYLLEGPLAALDQIEKATGEREVNALGYCVGGTLLGCTLAYLAYHNETRIRSATYLCALLDFSEPGELGALIDEKQLQWLEKEMQVKGYYDGRELAATFNALRPQDLIWSYYIKNYLLGESPAPHELLFWNSDATHIPEKMHRYYLRNMYLHNRLRESGALDLNGTPIDLKRVKVPAFFVATLQDHIAPWKSVYAGLKLHSGEAQFLLAGSGHIAGAINPPERNKYNYYSNPQSGETAEVWFKGAKEEAGSWWGVWETWLRQQSGSKVEARIPGETGLAILEDAPGSYVRVQVAREKIKEEAEA